MAELRRRFAAGAGAAGSGWSRPEPESARPIDADNYAAQPVESAYNGQRSAGDRRRLLLAADDAASTGGLPHL